MAEKVDDKLMSNKKTDRKAYCWNCLHWSKAQHKRPCNACFGVEDGKFFAYKNWEEGIDYVS